MPSWSSDSKWLAYVTRLDNYMGAVNVHWLADGKSTQVTDGMGDPRDPVWDKGGEFYLYFTASTDSGYSLQPDIQAMARNATGSVYLIVLDKDNPRRSHPRATRSPRIVRPAPVRSRPARPGVLRAVRPTQPQPCPR